MGKKLVGETTPDAVPELEGNPEHVVSGILAVVTPLEYTGEVGPESDVELPVGTGYGGAVALPRDVTPVPDDPGTVPPAVPVTVNEPLLLVGYSGAVALPRDVALLGVTPVPDDTGTVPPPVPVGVAVNDPLPLVG